MFDRFENLEEKLLELEQQLADPSLPSNQLEFSRVAKEHAHVTKLHNLYLSYKQTEQELADSRELLKAEEDEEMREMVRSEVAELTERLAHLEQELQVLLLPVDPNDAKNTLLEIRAGTGGDEAALFVNDLYKMYLRYAESRSWKVEVLSSNPIGIGGFKVIFVLV